MKPSTSRFVPFQVVILTAFLGLCLWLLPGTRSVRNDDDVLAFLPQDSEAVQGFYQVSNRFGMLEVALIGLDTQGEHGVFTPERITRLRELKAALETLSGVHMVLSFVDLPDPKITEEGFEVAALVPEDLTDMAEVRRRVLANENAVGNMVTTDGKAAALLVYLLPAKGQDAIDARMVTLTEIRELATKHWPEPVHFAGAPYIEQSASTQSRADIVRLSPIVIGVLAISSALLLGNIVAAVINIVLTGLGVGLVMGAHGVFGEPLTVVSSTLPVMMVAFGGAFGIHMLAGYQRHHGTSRQRAVAVLRELWLPVTLSGLTTIVAFFALMVMPQVPMQRFGVVAGLGVLVLLILSLVVLPSILALLPNSWLPPKPERPLPLRFRPPAWALLTLAVAGGILSMSLSADPDPLSMLDKDSEPHHSNQFFNQRFGGSTYLQIAAVGPLHEPVFLRTLRDLADGVRAVPGVVDVRSLVEPVAMLNEALGGRRGIPEDAARATRVMSHLADQPAMAQLMTVDKDAALIHIKLSPMSGEQQIQLVAKVREILASYAEQLPVRVATTSSMAEIQQDHDVRKRVYMLLGKPVDVSSFFKVELSEPEATPELLQTLTKLRDQALNSEDSPLEGVPVQEIAQVDPAALFKLRGAPLLAYLQTKLPSVAKADPEGLGYAAEHLTTWLEEALGKARIQTRCEMLQVTADQCKTITATLSELEDKEWRAPPGPGGDHVIRELPATLQLTGQPVVGQAFAESVETSSRDSTLISLAALLVVLLPFGHWLALIPAIWTLFVTCGVIALLGQPISIGTCIVTCIALGAGVDFAIHLSVRARQYGGAEAGAKAVNDIGVVSLISAVQLGLAFLVLLGSSMPPLRQFGVGLAVGLVGAALGAVWLMPILLRFRPPKKTSVAS